MAREKIDTVCNLCHPQEDSEEATTAAPAVSFAPMQSQLQSKLGGI